jgi:polyisoprenoid-binding protein YceI
MGFANQTNLDLTNTDLSRFAGTWRLDPERTSVVFHAKAAWILPVKGTLRAIEGSARVDADGRANGSVIIDAASIDTKNKRRDEHLRSADFFEVLKYPTITFTGFGARLLPSGKFEVSGQLTVHGQTSPLTLVAEVSVSADSATLVTQAVVDKRILGMKKAIGRSRVLVRAHFDRV